VFARARRCRWQDWLLLWPWARNDGGRGVSPAAASPKSHYVVLDGLRGVASVLVVIFHLFEAFSGGIPQNQIINHGYLAVDFFFLLSGFVIAYAYDDRWGTMSPWGFCKRRLVRLQPMVIAGTLLGALLFPLQDYSIFPKVASAHLWQILAVMLVGFTMIPLPAAVDIRGWGNLYAQRPGMVAVL
jgi:peptidoglycan/LPS O-acetylase OafA/YrhL